MDHDPGRRAVVEHAWAHATKLPTPGGIPGGMPAAPADPPACARARAAADAVRAIFGRRLAGIPGTWLPTIAGPGRRRWIGPWRYWWHAHVIDALVDEAHREAASGDTRRAGEAARLATALLRGARLRNLGVFTNRYYDDMAWIVLAAHRLDQLRGPHPLPRAAGRAIAPALRRGHTPDLGGGVYWNDRHDFKNSPATGPAALHFARIGETARARELLAWVHDRLLDPDTGLVVDGLRRRAPGQVEVVADLFTYNQGTVLAGLLTLGDPDSLRRAGDLVVRTRAHLTTDPDRRVLRAHGGGDGGLFTGILCRYLALAARSPALPDRVRQDAAIMVHATAEALWSGRTSLTLPPRRGMPSPRPGAPRTVALFSPDPARPAPSSPPAPAATRTVELSTQVQAWTVLEAAATLSAGGRPG